MHHLSSNLLSRAKIALCGLLLVCLASGVVAGETTEIRIGVLAFRGSEHAMESWSPTAEYLSRVIPDARFVIVPLPLRDLEMAVADNSIEYVFTNSGHYVVLEEKYGISRIATLKNPFGASLRNVFGAVIFSRTDREDLKNLADLRGKIFAAVRKGAFGGFQMAWRELKDQGIDPFTDFSELRFYGLPQDQIVFAVLHGEADAGTVRTDVLETMALEGKIELSDIRILNRQQVPGYDVALSTRLYPEWPFAKMPKAPEGLSEQVAIALLKMRADSPEMRAAGYYGWTVPLDYQPVHELFRELEIGPHAPTFDFSYLLNHYWEWILFAAALLAVIALHGILTEFLVQRRTRELSEVNRQLEHEMHEREIAEHRAREHEAELAHVSRISVIGEMTSGLAHELRQPLSAISNYAEGGIRRLQRQDGKAEDVKEALVHINEQAHRAAQIVARVRGYMKKRKPQRESVDINHAVREAMEFFKPDIQRNGIDVHLDLGRGIPPVLGDLIELEQLIINLARNALEAMSDTVGSKRLDICTRCENTRISVEVRDTGPGLNPANLEDIWKPFATFKEGGLGLGLAICRSIVEAHDGSIKALLPPEGGTTIRFEIPVSGEAHDPSA